MFDETKQYKSKIVLDGKGGWYYEISPDEGAKLKDAIERGLLVPVIRCRECIYWDDVPFITAAPDFHKCKRIAYHASTADGYCDRAERKE